MTVPVSYFVPDTSRMTRTLRQRLMDERDKRDHQLFHSQDWADFCKRKGEVVGLEAALQICTEVEQEMN